MKKIKIKTAFISLIIAIFMWLYIKLSDTYTYQMNIPIVTTNIKPGKTLKNELPEYAAVLMEGKGITLMGLLVLWKSDIKFFIDLSTINFSWDCELNKYINWINLPGGSEKIIVKEIVGPEVVYIELENQAEKKVPISTENIKIIPSESHIQVGKIKLIPDSLIILGPESKIIKINNITTEFAEYKNKKKPFKNTIHIKKFQERLFKYGTAETDISVDIQILGERTLESIGVKVTKIPGKYNIRI